MLKCKIKSFYIILVAIFICASYGCSFNHFDSTISKNALLLSEMDIAQKQWPLNDSILKIMLHPKKIICKLGCANPMDSLRSDTIKILPKKMYPVLEFLIWDSSNFESNDIVYGYFSTCANYIIKGHGVNEVTVQFDFGLRKWRILDKESNIVFCADLKNENLPILRFTRVIFPTDLTLQLMNNNLESLPK